MNSSDIAFEVRLETPHGPAIERVTAELKAEGFGVLTRVDLHDAFREKLGETFRPYTILGACNPKLAFRALSHRGDVGLLLPCNVTVEADGDEASVVRITDPGVLMGVGAIGSDEEIRAVAHDARVRLERVANALDTVV